MPMKTLASEGGRNRRRATTAVSRKKKKLASGLCKKELQKQSPTDQTKGSLFIGLQCPGWRATMSQPLPPPPSVNQSALLFLSLFQCQCSPGGGGSSSSLPSTRPSSAAADSEAQHNEDVTNRQKLEEFYVSVWWWWWWWRQKTA